MKKQSKTTKKATTKKVAKKVVEVVQKIEEPKGFSIIESQNASRCTICGAITSRIIAGTKVYLCNNSCEKQFTNKMKAKAI